MLKENPAKIPAKVEHWEQPYLHIRPSSLPPNQSRRASPLLSLPLVLLEPDSQYPHLGDRMKRLGSCFKLKDSGKEQTTSATGSDDEHPSFRLNVETFSFSELSSATADFSKNHEIGSGSSGKVYEGHLPDIGKVAVKQFCFDATSSDIHRKNEFLKEVYVLNSMNHPNIVKLIGCCSEGSESLLVYEYMPLGNLRECLSDEKIDLDWDTRMKIALGAARGLEQLHLKANPPIIHRDFKSTNILLDKDFQPKVSDFGIAKIAPTGDELIATTAGLKGTPGYIAPEYSLCASLSIRSDIYSFGVVLLEIITGRKALDWTRPDAEQNLAYWSKFWSSGSFELLGSTANIWMVFYGNNGDS